MTEKRLNEQYCCLTRAKAASIDSQLTRPSMRKCQISHPATSNEPLRSIDMFESATPRSPPIVILIQFQPPRQTRLSSQYALETRMKWWGCWMTIFGRGQGSGCATLRAWTCTGPHLHVLMLRSRRFTEVARDCAGFCHSGQVRSNPERLIESNTCTIVAPVSGGVIATRVRLHAASNTQVADADGRLQAPSLWRRPCRSKPCTDNGPKRGSEIHQCLRAIGLRGLPNHQWLQRPRRERRLLQSDFGRNTKGRLRESLLARREEAQR